MDEKKEMENESAAAAQEMNPEIPEEKTEAEEISAETPVSVPKNGKKEKRTC